MDKTRRLILAWQSTNKNPRYSLHDAFSADLSAGEINLSLATDGQSVRYVTDVNNLITLTSGKINVAGTQTPSEDFKPALWYDAFPRGYLIAATILPGNRGPDYVGWYKTPEKTGAGTWGNDHSIRFVSNNVYAGLTTGGSGALGAYTSNIEHKVIVWAKVSGGGEIWIKGGIWSVWTKIHTDTTLTTPVLFPASSWYVDASPRNSSVDLFNVCRYQGNNWDRYFSCGGTPRAIVKIAFFGDSKSIGYYWPSLMNSPTHAFQEIPTGRRVGGFLTTRMATSGATVATRASTIVADLAAISETPTYILWNLGANDVASLPAEATWKANAQTCIDAMVTKWSSIKIYFMRVWRRSELTDCNSLATWYGDLVTANPDNCFLGPDERVFLEGGNDGETWTLDGIHPTVTAGYQLTANQWRNALGY